MSEDTNPQGSVEVQPSTRIDDPSNLQFEDSFESTPEPEAQEVAVETGEEEVEAPAEAPQETEETTADEQTGEAESEGQASEEPEPEAKPDEVVVTMDTGEQLPVKELKLGYMRQADYTRKTQENAQERKALEASAERINATIDAFSNYLASQLPPEPDPQLAFTNAEQFTQQKAVYDAALNQVRSIIELGGQSKSAAQEMTQEQRERTLQEENTLLLQKLPALKDEAKRQEFNKATFETARKLGFSAEELNQTTDHRMLVLGHYARLGLEAEQNKAKVAKKAESAPPAKPVKGRVQSKDTGSEKQKAAIARLNKTGSIHDALKVDFV